MNSILDDNMTSLTLVQLRQKLLDNGFLRTYGDDRELTIEKSDDIKVKVTLSPGLNVQTKTPTLGNPVQIFATIATLICSWVFAGGAIGILGAVLLGWGISYFYYRSKINNLADEVRRIAQQQ